MKFTAHEKEIIRKIAEGKVYNIASCLEAFGLTTKRKLDESDIEARMRQEEQGTTYKKVKDGVDRFVNVTTTNGEVIPIEVKAGNTATKSLNLFMENYKPSKAIKLITGNVGEVDSKLTIPHYLAMFV